MAGCSTQRLSALGTLSFGYQPNSRFKVPDFEQSKRFWYQWLQCIDGGIEAVRKDPVGFARIQWETWSPPGWFDEDEFAATAEGFSHPDWVAITLNAYRARWVKGEEADSRHDSLQRRLCEVECLSTPTLMIRGGSDYCDDPKESEGLERYFTGRYERLLIEGVGHFPHREGPQQVAEAVIRLVQNSGRPTVT
jgi:pimeloyl-ACP methyl ester carboxylesterase